MIFAKVVGRSKKKKKTKRKRRRDGPIFTMVKIDINKEVKKQGERTAKHKDSHKRGNGRCKKTVDE